MIGKKPSRKNKCNITQRTSVYTSMKKLYYTVQFETATVNEVVGLTGNKTVTVYSMKNNAPKKFFDVECEMFENSTQKIIDYLNDNGHGDEQYELILL